MWPPPSQCSTIIKTSTFLFKASRNPLEDWIPKRTSNTTTTHKNIFYILPNAKWRQQCSSQSLSTFNSRVLLMGHPCHNTIHILDLTSAHVLYIVTKNIILYIVSVSFVKERNFTSKFIGLRAYSFTKREVLLFLYWS